MNRVLAAAAVLLAVLLAVQTWRVHALQRHRDSQLDAASQKESTSHLNLLQSEGAARFNDADLDESVNETDPLIASAQPKTSVPSPAPGRTADDENLAGAPNSAGKKKTSNANAPETTASTNQLPARLRKSMSQAGKAFADGDYEAALKLMEDAVKEFPSEGQAYAVLAKMYNDLGMSDDAIRAYQDWTAAMPEDARAFLGAAGLYESLGMNAEALDSLSQYERLKDGAPDSYPAAASMYRRLGMPEQELNALTNWVDTAPTSPQAYLALGEYYRRNGDPAAALVQYQQASTLAPGNVTAHSSLALAYQQLGQYESAQAELQTAAALRPGDMSLQMRLADVYRRAGDLNSAIAAYQTVMQQEPNGTLALRASQQIARLQQQINAQRRKSG